MTHIPEHKQIPERKLNMVHPLIPAHFARKLQTELKVSWDQGHRCLFYHFQKDAPAEPRDLSDVLPLYRAVAHGCRAGMYLEAFQVYWLRIAQQNRFFGMRTLAAYGEELAAMSGFFEEPWLKTVPGLPGTVKGFVLGIAAFCLRATGKLRDALEPMRRSREAFMEANDLPHAAQVAGYLAEMLWTLGDLSGAHVEAEKSVELADAIPEADPSRPYWMSYNRTTLGDVLERLGRLPQSKEVFADAERKAGARLIGIPGARYADLLVRLNSWEEASSQARHGLEDALSQPTESKDVLAIARYYLCLGKVNLRKPGGGTGGSEKDLETAVGKLQTEARVLEDVPMGLVARAELYRSKKEYQRAKEDLELALKITRHCASRVLEADSHLEYVRLCLAKSDSKKAQEHWQSASDIIKEIGYELCAAELEALRQRIHV